MNVFRTFFFLLLLANLLLFAYGQGYFGQDAGLEPERLAQQVGPDQVRMLASGEAAAAVRKKLMAPPDEACRALGDFAREQAARITALLRGKHAELRFTERALGEPAGYWVFLPALPTKKAADERVATLKKNGVTEMFVMTEEGTNLHAISLGLFKSEQAANDYLQTLKKKGVTGAKVVPRLSAEARILLEVRGPGAVVTDLQRLIGTAVPDVRIAECATQ